MAAAEPEGIAEMAEGPEGPEGADAASGREDGKVVNHLLFHKALIDVPAEGRRGLRGPELRMAAKRPTQARRMKEAGY